MIEEKCECGSTEEEFIMSFVEEDNGIQIEYYDVICKSCGKNKGQFDWVVPSV